MDASVREAWIGAGSNLGDRLGHLERAVLWLTHHREVEVLDVSSWRETAPIGPPQPDYLNGVIHVQTSLSPLAFLRVLQALEAAAGRIRTERWGPRTLDLDVLLFEGCISDLPALRLPHPLLPTRRFVLEPLVELSPELIHPVLDRTMRDLLEALTI